MQLYKQAHTAYKTQYHIVWVTRYRRKILCHGIDTYLTAILKGLREFFPDVYILEIGIDPEWKDHVHIHVIIPPKYAVSRIVEAIKSNTSRMIRKKFSGFLTEVYWDGGGIWGTGFFVSTIGINEEIIKHYVQQQGEHDVGQLEEL